MQRSGKRFSQATWIVADGYTIIHEGHDTPRNLPIELPQHLPGRV
jgi:hypothetical protein